MAKRTKNKVPAAILKRLARARGWVCDMDGTLVLGANCPSSCSPTARRARRGNTPKPSRTSASTLGNGT
jgi:hypothetical protein